MGVRRRVVAAVAALVVVGTTVGVVAVRALASAPPNVTTAAYDNLRSGWDPNEPNLAPSDVTSATFGQIFTRKLKGSIYSQPLVVNGTVIVTTEKAWAYGINATTGAIKWKRHFGKPLLASTIQCGDLTPDLGSTSTPVVDPSTGTVYLTTRLQKGKGPTNNHTYLQALSVTTGREVANFPVELDGTPDNTPGVPFAEDNELQRPALLLLGGVVYAAFSSDCDDNPYRGIVIGVSTTTHAITAMWSDEAGAGTDQNSMSGIWQSGGGLVSDGPNQILLTTGNGIAPPASPGDDPPPTLSESVVRLRVNTDGTLTPTDYFSPGDAPSLDQGDQDLGAGAPIALPSQYFGTSADPDLLVQVGKDGRIFLLNRDALGGREQGPSGADDTIETLGPFNGVWGHLAAYGGEGGWVYLTESTGGGYLRALSYGTNGSGVPELTSAGTSANTFGYSSGSPEVTSNGTTPGSAVVWVVYAGGPSGDGGELQAYGAIPSSASANPPNTLPLLWESPIGTASKFSVSTAYNGMVYVGNRSGVLYAFGAKSNAPLQAAPVDFGRVATGSSKTVEVTVTANRPLTLTGAAPATGELNVAGASGTTVPNAGAGYQGSTGASGATALTPGNQEFSVPAFGHRRLDAGQSTTISVTFRPRTTGAVVADVTLRTTAGARTLALTGYGAAPGLLLSAPPVSFGVLDTGAGGKTLTFTVSNSGLHPETITSVTLPGAPFTVKGLPHPGSVLAPQQSVTAAVTYDPTVPGTNDSFVTIASDAGSVSVPVTGAADVGTAVLTLSTPSVDFGDVAVGQSKTLSFHINNTGNIPLTIDRAAAPSGVFSTSHPLPEGITLDPGSSLVQAITFRPTAAGPFSAQYRFSQENGQPETVIGFTGTGTAS